jgi:hypothetical protein
MVAGPWTLEAWTSAVSGLGHVAWLLPVFSAIEWVSRRERHPLQWTALPRPVRWLGYSAVIWLTLWQAQRSTGAFIYFQF